MLIIGLFVFILLGFAWALSDDDIKEIEDRFKLKQSGGGCLNKIILFVCSSQTWCKCRFESCPDYKNKNYEK